jgi:uncharacterized membrane protein YebE (DUF533 family)
MLALTTDSIKGLGAGAIVVVVVLGVTAALLVQKLVAKVVSLVAMALIALLLFNQRASIKDCANKVKAEAPGAVTGRVTDPTCTFLGFKVKVPLDKVGG